MANDQHAIKPFTEAQLLSLYRNEHIKEAHQSTEAFLNSELGLCITNGPLSESLNDYLRSRLNFIASESRLEKLQKELEDEESQVWKLREEKVENEGLCHDKNKVVTIHKFKVANFNHSAASNVSRSMRHIREELFEQHSLCSYKASKVKAKIDLQISKICEDIELSRDNLIAAISILFSFQRKVISDHVFVTDTRSWLDLLIKTLLQSNPTFKDHLLLLNHVLRCPPGVGNWGSCYTQIPAPLFQESDVYMTNQDLDQMIALLSILFTPVKGRRELLREYCTPDTFKKNDEIIKDPWVVLDSDGEDEENVGAFPLRENDYVALLGQFPFEALFRYLLQIDYGIESYDPSKFSTNSFFKLFAFGTQFVNLLKSGLQLFSSPSYRQLAKRLGHIIKHTLAYISDHWDSFRQSKLCNPEEGAILSRIEVEFSNFFLRSAKSIFCSSASSGMWQYLAVIPYHLVNEDVLWHSLAIYHFVDDATLQSLRQKPNFRNQIEGKLKSSDFSSSFEDTLSGLPDTEVMFLLTTFANMATSTPSPRFIELIVSELLSIGFVNDLTTEAHAKGCRDLITNIVREHTAIMSHLLDKFTKEPLLVENSETLTERVLRLSFVSRELCPNAKI